MAEFDDRTREMVLKRLSRFPANIKINIGGDGDFTRDQLMQEVRDHSKIGDYAIEMQLAFIRKMAKATQ